MQDRVSFRTRPPYSRGKSIMYTLTVGCVGLRAKIDLEKGYFSPTGNRPTIP